MANDKRFFARKLLTADLSGIPSISGTVLAFFAANLVISDPQYILHDDLLYSFTIRTLSIFVTVPWIVLDLVRNWRAQRNSGVVIAVVGLLVIGWTLTYYYTVGRDR
jgi:hypothetical protein